MPAHFPATIELSDLNGQNGFKINGIAVGDYSGFSVASAGDVNADGVADMIIGAYKADPNGSNSGQSYIIFGGSSVGSSGTIQLSSLNGSNGFKINGIAASYSSGYSVASAGDVNADGVEDMIIGARGASPNGSGSGQSHVIFGGSGVGGSGTIQLSSLNGSNGFKINGIAAGDSSGISVASAGDVNADGVEDMIIGASNADPNGSGSGQSYIIFGGVGVGSSGTFQLSNLNGSNGFKMNGIAANDWSGSSVASVGDVNADGVEDMIIGAYGSNQSYVIFGGSGVGSSGTIQLSSLNGSNGFKINGIAASDFSGISVASAGDINADGVADMIIGASRASPNGSYSGQSYIIFGRSGVGSSGTLQLSSLNGANGFKINGIAAGDISGRLVASAGDINVDGAGDIMIGANGADPNGSFSGQSYVIFGGVGVGSSGILQLSSLNGSNGFKINGISASDNSGFSAASAGDINGDGVGDLIIGADGASLNGSGSGQSYIIFGEAAPPDLINNQFTVIQGEAMTLTNNILQLNISDSQKMTIPYYHITDFVRCQFAFSVNPSVAINNFSQADINQGKVIFTQDGSLAAPSFNLNIYKNFYQSGIIPANITFAVYPEIIRNNLFIIEGQTVNFTTADLEATDALIPADKLQFFISDLTHGEFISMDNPSQSILQFPQSAITQGKIRFIHDNTNNDPTYSVTVSNGVLQVGPNPALINFTPVNKPPVLITNQFVMNPHGATILTSDNLKANDEETPAANLRFIVIGVTHGHFERVVNPGDAISQFIQLEVNTAGIQFLVDASNQLPQFNISVSDGELQTTFVPAHVQFAENTSTINSIASTKNIAARNILIGVSVTASVFGSLFLVYLAMGRLAKHRLCAVTNQVEEKEYYESTIIPIAEAVFKQVKISSVMNYVSSDAMQAYVVAIAEIFRILKDDFDLHINLSQMEAKDKTRYLNQIVREIKHQISKPMHTCSRVWVRSFFQPQISPEQLRNQASIIAERLSTVLTQDAVGIHIPDEIDLKFLTGSKNDSPYFALKN